MAQQNDIYSITGLFQDVDNPQGFQSFGGHFLVPNRNSDASKIFQKTFTGTLTDVVGNSTIDGRVTDRVLEFVKKYNGQDTSIIYAFEKNDRGVFTGTYNCPEKGFSGKAFAKIHLDWESTILEGVPTYTSDELVTYLIQEGHLKLFKEKPITLSD